MKMVVRQGLTLAGVGSAIGLIASYALTRLMKTMLFGVSATDPLIFTVIALSLVLIALFACWMPARRAAKVAGPDDRAPKCSRCQVSEVSGVRCQVEICRVILFLTPDT